MHESYEDKEYDPDDLFRGPNDNAYQKDELRTGPPLSYIAEKFRCSIEMTHYLLNSLNETSDIDAGQKDRMLFQARGAFRYQLTSYLALQNMLALANDQKVFGRMERLSSEDFRDWLDRLDRGGSVTG